MEFGGGGAFSERSISNKPTRRLTSISHQNQDSYRQYLNTLTLKTRNSLIMTSFPSSKKTSSGMGGRNHDISTNITTSNSLTDVSGLSGEGGGMRNTEDGGGEEEGAWRERGRMGLGFVEKMMGWFEV